jgi:3-hydroxyisobutyrate dehydrogenase
MEKQKVGFVGLGVMGFPMAQHLATAGYPLTAYDINQDTLARLKGKLPGITIVASPKAVAESSQIVVTMLPHGREVEAVVFGADGLSQGFKPGDLLVDTSSSEPWHTRETSGRLVEMGVAMVDAPVSGAEIGALNAELVFMVGGDAASVDRVRPLLAVLGKTVFHLGPIGSGHAMKSINNLITAVTFLATAEGLVIGKSYGLDPAVMTDVLNVSTGMSWITRMHIAQRIISRTFDDPFKFDLMMKDINIALKIASDGGLQMPLSQANQALWQQTRGEIAESSSVSELVRALETRLGIEISASQPDETSGAGGPGK